MKSQPLPRTLAASGVATPRAELTPGVELTPRAELTQEQRAIVETGDGPVVVIAGAGTGKTRVIVERVRWLLETKGARLATTGAFVPAEPQPRHGNSFDGPLVPEQLLVLTYNVKAARELQDRIDAAVGPATRARMTVSNFHSFCQHVLTESSADAGPAEHARRCSTASASCCSCAACATRWTCATTRTTRTRASSRSSTGPRTSWSRRTTSRPGWTRSGRSTRSATGRYEAVEERLRGVGGVRGISDARAEYAGLRRWERARDAGDPAADGPRQHAEEAPAPGRHRGARGPPLRRRRRPRRTGCNHFDADERDRIGQLAAEYERDGAAFEILRLDELAQVYRAYEEALAARGALDFGEQIALVTRLFKERPNVLRRWQRQYRYILVDEFQDANVAQIELIELLGRTPDRPDNVMVVGDDDQSIYRFRGASFAAFAEFRERFSRPPAHDPAGPAPGAPRSLAIEQNFRSVRHVLDGANRLIRCNDTRFAPDKALRTDREPGHPIELLVCAGPEDEAVAIVDAIRGVTGSGSERPWGDVAILYRKHKHRDAIVDRLRAEDIPYTVVGGLSLFETPEIRDLDQALRAIADPTNDPALVRMMTAGPWRLDALEILTVTRDARFDRSHVIAAVKRMVERGERTEDAAGEEPDRDRRTRTATVPAEIRARLRNLLAAIEELNPRTWRDGPYAILERYVELTGVVLSLLAAGTLEAKRSVVNIASFLRFAADWQGANPAGTLADFVDYLDAYTAAGGELPTAVELSEDVEGVRLMTLYQAKGLEFPVVIVPNLLDGEWPVKEQGFGWFPRELLREQVPGGNLHTDEERRLLYVAMTRAQERLLLSTHAGAAAKKRQSQFVGELLEDHGAELVVRDRTLAAGEGGGARAAAVDAGTAADDELAQELDERADGTDDDPDTEVLATAAALAAARRVMPLPTARERRLVLRLRAAELVGLMEASAASDPEAADARAGYEARLVEIGRAAAMSADEARAAGLDPLTFRTVALDTGAGANLLRVAPAPSGFSYSSLDTFARCPLRFALKYVYRIPGPDRPKAFFSFGNTAHEAFEAFTRVRRERIARGEAPPTREDLGRLFAERWVPAEFGDATTEAGYARRADTLLDNFWTSELAGRGRGPVRGAEVRAGPGARRRLRARPHLRRHRPHRPAPDRRHRGHRLQDRQHHVPEEGRGEPPAHHLRPGLPRDPGPRHPREGDPLLHRERPPHVHHADGRAAGRGPREDPGRGGADPRRRVHRHAGLQDLPVLRLPGDVPGEGVMNFALNRRGSRRASDWTTSGRTRRRCSRCTRSSRPRATAIHGRRLRRRGGR